MGLTEDDKKWFDTKFAIMTQEFDAKLERIETKLLTEFHKWASPIDARAQTHNAVLRALEMDFRIEQRNSNPPR